MTTTAQAIEDLLTAADLVEANCPVNETTSALVVAATNLRKSLDTEITDTMIDDITCAALEGGIDYWCSKVKVLPALPQGVEFAAKALTHGCSLRLRVIREGDDSLPETVELTAAKLRRGIRREATRRGMTAEKFYGNHDAGDADNAVQLAVFGALIFG